MPLGRRRAVRRLPLFGALQIRCYLFFELFVADLRRKRNGTTPSRSPYFKRKPFPPGERPLVLIAMAFHVRRARRGKVSVVEPHGRTVRIEINDDSVRGSAHGAED